MRILMLAQFYAPIVGGEERMTQSLAGELAQRDHDVVVATLVLENPRSHIERLGGYP